MLYNGMYIHTGKEMWSREVQCVNMKAMQGAFLPTTVPGAGSHGHQVLLGTC